MVWRSPLNRHTGGAMRCVMGGRANPIALTRGRPLLMITSRRRCGVWQAWLRPLVIRLLGGSLFSSSLLGALLFLRAVSFCTRPWCVLYVDIHSGHVCNGSARVLHRAGCRDARLV